MKRLIVMLLGLLLLSGCTLAQGNGQSKDDELVGMLISISDPENQGTIHSFQSQGERFYAERYEKNGQTHYRFPEGAGLECFGYVVDSEDPYMEYVVAPELSDVHRTTHLGEGAAKDHTEVTLYAAEGSQTIAHMNPVFQTPEGDIYALGIAAMGHPVASMHGSTSLDWNGGIIHMTGEAAVLPERIRILQMDANHQMLQSAEFAADALPESFDPGQAAYLLLEEIRGEEIVRSLYDPEAGPIKVLVRGRYDLGSVHYIQISWEG